MVTPLRPQSLSLSSQVYQSFERDTAKYELYGEAMRLAVAEWTAAHKHPPVVAVVGAGRGGIVLQALRLFPLIRGLVVVEKNLACRPVLLQRLRDWATDTHRTHFLANNCIVRFVDCSQLSLHGTTLPKIGILVSEMMGCFGCDEMAPEIISQRVSVSELDHRVMYIPQRIVSLLQPVCVALPPTELSLATHDLHSSEDTARRVFTPRWLCPLSSPVACFSHTFPCPPQSLRTVLTFSLCQPPSSSVSLVWLGSMHTTLFSTGSNDTVEIRSGHRGAAGWGYLILGERPMSGVGESVTVSVDRIWGENKYEIQEIPTD